MCFPGGGLGPDPCFLPFGLLWTGLEVSVRTGPELTQPPPPATASNVLFCGSGPGIWLGLCAH